jgi:WD40 repeat protein
MKKSYEDLMKGNEITAFTCDSQMKRFYLGDNSGFIKCFNLSTGDFIKDFIKHENEIVNVIHSSKNEFYDKLNAKNQLKMQKLQILENLNMSKSILETQF